jgi:hypothetical protein
MRQFDRILVPDKDGHMVNNCHKIVFSVEKRQLPSGQEKTG